MEYLEIKQQKIHRQRNRITREAESKKHNQTKTEKEKTKAQSKPNNSRTN